MVGGPAEIYVTLDVIFFRLAETAGERVPEAIWAVHGELLHGPQRRRRLQLTDEGSAIVRRKFVEFDEGRNRSRGKCIAQSSPRLFFVNKTQSQNGLITSFSSFSGGYIVHYLRNISTRN